MRTRSLHNLELRANELTSLAVDRLFEGRSLEEVEFLCVQGYFPEAAEHSERIERTVVTHGLRTTIVLERERE